MICSKCGYVANDTDRFCTKCGAPLVIPAPVPDEAPTEAVEERIEEPAAQAAEAVEEKIEEPVVQAAEAVEERIEEPVAQAAEAVEEKVEEPVVQAAEAVEEKIEEPVAPVIPAAPVTEPARNVKYDAQREVKPSTVPAPAKRAEDPLSKPLSIWGYLWRIVLFSIPILNIIPLFVFAFSSGINKNSKHFAAAVLILMMICLLFSVGFLVLLFLYTDAVTISNWIKSIFGYLPAV